MSDPRNKQLGQIRRVATVVELRMRAARALRVLPTALTIALAIAAATLAVRKTFPDHLSDRRAWQILIGAALLVVCAVLIALLRRLPPRAGTIALDRHHGLHDRLTNALAFEAIAPEARSPLMEVAIDDACERAVNLDARKASPLRVPSDLAASLAVSAGVAMVALLYVPKPQVVILQAKTIDALAMSPDDVELFRDAAKQLSRQDQSPEVKAAVERFNQLIEDIASKRLDRTEAFRRMEAIERELLKGAEADAKSFEEALKEAGEELSKSDLAKPVGDSLSKKDLEKAKKDLKELAAELRDGKKKPDKAALDKLRQALAKAASRKKDALAAINEKRNEIREQLLNKKSQKKDDPDAGEKNPEDERLLKKKERELERLDREAEQKERVGRQLDRLDRALSKAAEDLLKDLGMSAQDLEQAAEDINRLQEEQMSDQEKEELRQRLEELRELLRQQGQAGKQRMARMMKFGKRAHGGSGKNGEKGQEQSGQDQDGQEGQDGQDGQEGQDGQNGQGNGQKSGGQGGKQWVLGPGGKKILISGGQGQGQGEGQGQGQGQQQGQGQDSPGGAPGKGIGSSHDGNVAGKRTDLKSGTTDVQEQGLDSKQGPSNSEVILGAAERGFKGSGYKKVFTQYHTVAEQQINKDQVPDGYRFYVHRYFQLIRPRE